MYYGDDSFDTQTSSDELTPEYQPTDQDYRDMAEAWGEEMWGDDGMGDMSGYRNLDDDYHETEADTYQDAFYDQEPEDLFSGDEW